MEEIVSLNGSEFRIWYDRPADRQNALAEAESKCTTCGLRVDGIQSLATTCPSSNKYVGDTVSLSVVPSGGTPPYTIRFWRSVDGITKTTLGTPGVATSYAYTCTAVDSTTNVAGGWGHITLGVDVTDSCPTGGVINSDLSFCTVAVGPICVPPLANLTVT